MDENKETEISELEGIFRLMTDWKALPKYQLERRADIFFAWFLPLILIGEFGGKITHKDIIPEFPIRPTSRLDPSKKVKETDHTSNIDYVIFCKALQNNDSIEKPSKKVFFIELKTDIESFCPKQLMNMIKHENIPKLIDYTTGYFERAKKRNRGDSKKRERAKFEMLESKITKNTSHDNYNNTAEICYIGPEKLKEKMTTKLNEYNANNISTEDILENKIRIIPFSKILGHLGDHTDPPESIANDDDLLALYNDPLKMQFVEALEKWIETEG